MQIRKIWKKASTTGYKGSTCPEIHKTNLQNKSIDWKKIDDNTIAYLMESRHVEDDPKPVESEKQTPIYDAIWRKNIVRAPSSGDSSDDEFEPNSTGASSSENASPIRYLHMLGGNVDYRNNLTIYNRRLKQHFGEKDHLSVYQPSTENFVVAGPKDKLA